MTLLASNFCFWLQFWLQFLFLAPKQDPRIIKRQCFVFGVVLNFLEIISDKLFFPILHSRKLPSLLVHKSNLRENVFLLKPIFHSESCIVNILFQFVVPLISKHARTNTFNIHLPFWRLKNDLQSHFYFHSFNREIFFQFFYSPS